MCRGTRVCGDSIVAVAVAASSRRPALLLGLPMINPADCAVQLDELELSQAGLRNFTCDNAKRVFRLTG